MKNDSKKISPNTIANNQKFFEIVDIERESVSPRKRLIDNIESFLMSEQDELINLCREKKENLTLEELQIFHKNLLDELKGKYHSKLYQQYFIEVINHFRNGIEKTIKIKDLLQDDDTIKSDYERLDQTKTEKINPEYNIKLGYFNRFRPYKIDFYCLKLGFRNYREAEENNFDINNIPLNKNELNSYNEKIDLFKKANELAEEGKELGIKIHVDTQFLVNEASKTSDNFDFLVDASKQHNSQNEEILKETETIKNEFEIVKRKLESQLKNELALKKKKEELLKLRSLHEKENETKKPSETTTNLNYFKTNLYFIILCVFLFAIIGYLFFLNQKNQEKYYFNKERYESQIDSLINRLNKLSLKIESKSKTLDTLNESKKYYLEDTKSIISTNYDTIINIKDNFFKIRNNNKYGVMNSNNEIILPIKYNELRYIKSNLFFVKKENYFGVYNVEGRLVYPVIYESLEFNNESNVIIAKKKKKYALLSVDGKSITDFEYDKIIFSYGDTIAKVEKNNKFGFIDTDGKTLGDVKYDDVRYSSKDLLIVKLNNKWGYINRRGEIVIPVIYDMVSHFNSHTQAVAVLNGRRITINIRGECVYNCSD